MKVLPAIDIKGGKCVQLVGGKPGTEKIEIEDALGVARKWQSEGAEMIHIIDLDSALGTGSNVSQIEMLVADLDIPVQVGGGIRTLEQVQRLFDIGCERVIIGTKAILDRPFVAKLADLYPDSMVVALDSVANEIMIQGWQEGSGRDLLQVAQDLSSLGFGQSTGIQSETPEDSTFLPGVSVIYEERVVMPQVRHIIEAEFMHLGPQGGH